MGRLTEKEEERLRESFRVMYLKTLMGLSDQHFRDDFDFQMWLTDYKRYNEIKDEVYAEFEKEKEHEQQ